MIIHHCIIKTRIRYKDIQKLTFYIEINGQSPKKGGGEKERQRQRQREREGGGRDGEIKR